MKKKIILIRLILLLTLISYASCKKFLDISEPIDQITAKEVFDNDATATAAVTGLYYQMMVSNLYLMNGALSVYTALSSDELAYTTTSTTLTPFYQNAVPSSSTIISTNLWRFGYNYIYQANSCIENINASENLSITVKQQLIGEMLFTRAICYFYLVNLFGDVPLETSSDYTVNEKASRTSSNKIYDQIIRDLIQAENTLPVAYPTLEKARPNKYAAAALLSRVYLYNKDYVNAEAQASIVISSNVYSLSNLSNIFLANSSEAIWQLAPVSTTYNSAEGATFIPSSGTVKPSYALSSFLLNAFEAGDLRKTNWLKSNTVSGIVYYYPYKYKVRTGTAKTEYNTVLRLAELYLIRAEARAQQNNITGAINDLNVIRTRAGISTLSTTLSQLQAIANINKENRIEFLTEWGHRWLDLKRNAQADDILGTEKNGWTSTAALYPIPYTEILRNKALVQNIGYN